MQEAIAKAGDKLAAHAEEVQPALPVLSLIWLVLYIGKASVLRKRSRCGIGWRLAEHLSWTLGRYKEAQKAAKTKREREEQADALARALREARAIPTMPAGAVPAAVAGGCAAGSWGVVPTLPQPNFPPFVPRGVAPPGQG